MRLIVDGVLQATPFLDITVDALVHRQRARAAVDRLRARLRDVRAASTSTSTRSPNGDIEIWEYRRSAADPDVADPTRAVVLSRSRTSGAANHNGGQLQFGTGRHAVARARATAAARTTSSGNAQNPTSRLGKLLRLDPRGAGTVIERSRSACATRGGSRSTARRDDRDRRRRPGRCARRSTSALAANYGWPCREGAARLSHRPGLRRRRRPPTRVLEKSHSADGFCAIIGGYVVRDPGLPTLLGRYIYGDYCASALRSVDLASAGRRRRDRA